MALRTYYVLEVPIQVDQIDFGLTPQQCLYYNRAHQTDIIGRLELELEATGNGLVWNKDRFDIIPGLGTAQWNGLNVFCKLTKLKIICVNLIKKKSKIFFISITLNIFFIHSECMIQQPSTG